MDIFLAALVLAFSVGGVLWILKQRGVIHLPLKMVDLQPFQPPKIKVEKLSTAKESFFSVKRTRQIVGQISGSASRYFLLVKKVALNILNQAVVLAKPLTVKYTRLLFDITKRAIVIVFELVKNTASKIQKLPADYAQWRKEQVEEGKRRERFYSKLLKSDPEKTKQQIKKSEPVFKAPEDKVKMLSKEERTEIPAVKKEKLKDVELVEKAKERDQFRKLAWQAREERLLLKLEKNPRDVMAYKKLGKLYFNQGNYEGARSALEAAVNLGAREERIQKMLQRARQRLQ